MHSMKKPVALVREDDISGTRRSYSVSEVHDDILNMTPRLSQHYPNIHFDRRRQDQYSSTSSFMTCSEVSMPKSASELIKEISTLEHEVVQLERYLLSLYRTAFDQCLTDSSTNTTQASKSPPDWHSSNITMIERQASNSVSYNHMNDNLDRSQSTKKTEIIRENNFGRVEDTCSGPTPQDDPKFDEQTSMPGHQSLVDHLGASIFDHVPQIACKLSEDIIRCMCAIYCKLSTAQTQQLDLLASPTPSSSPSSTLSARDVCDSWSPRCHYEAATASPCSYYSPTDERNPYSGMVEIPRISVDGDKFGYASKMLNIFRSLIRKLEKVNLENMDHEEKLAFWINIHNALVMHAFLAYGLHHNQMRSTLSIMKAAYNIGGQSVNAYDIQSSILGCQLHRHASGIRSLFSPSKSLKKVNGKHPYALKLSDPSAHFALCSGAYSDPAVRVYTAKNIHQELKLAKDEFIKANVRVEKGRKIIIPKILCYYAKDASLELSSLTRMVSESMPATAQKNLEECLVRRKIEKCVEWSPYKSSFRYLMRRDLAKS